MVQYTLEYGYKKFFSAIRIYNRLRDDNGGQNDNRYNVIIIYSGKHNNNK